MDNIAIKHQILNKIKEYNRIIITRHYRPDGDAVGSTAALREILRATYPEKEVYLVAEDSSDYLEFLDVTNDEVADDKFAEALYIVIDTATADRTSDKRSNLAREIIKIDHHVDISPFGDLVWVEDWRSSACEMIADLAYTLRAELKITNKAVKYLYTGMVTDSGRFKYSSVSGETMRLAGWLLDFGVDTDVLYANLYLEDFEYIKFKSEIYKEIHRTEHGVAYMYIDTEMRESFGMTMEQASATVSMLDSIKGSIIWAVFIQNPDSSIRVRLRSRFVTINKLAERYHGGGHECASGATCYTVEEMNSLLADADALIKDYKENNEGWL